MGAKRAARLIAISDAVAGYAKANARIEHKRVTTIHCGIDPQPYDALGDAPRLALRSEWGVPADATIIGTVTRLAGPRVWLVVGKVLRARHANIRD